MSSSELLAACERASEALGWRVTQKHATGLTCVQIAPTPMATGNPVTIEVNLSRGTMALPASHCKATTSALARFNPIMSRNKSKNLAPQLSEPLRSLYIQNQPSRTRVMCSSMACA